MILNEEGLKNRTAWETAGYRLPAYDRTKMVLKTRANPVWLHFGAGNIFKAFQADVCQRLLDAGLGETGIIAVERREKKPQTSDNCVVKVTLRSDGSVEKAVIGSIAETVYLYGNEARLKEIFENPSLQMVSFTITEQATALSTETAAISPMSLLTLPAVPKRRRAIWGVSLPCSVPVISETVSRSP